MSPSRNVAGKSMQSKNAVVNSPPKKDRLKSVHVKSRHRKMLNNDSTENYLIESQKVEKTVNNSHRGEETPRNYECTLGPQWSVNRERAIVKAYTPRIASQATKLRVAKRTG